MTSGSSSIVLVIDARGWTLQVLQRGGVFAGHWLLPGGRLEPGESFRAAAARELEEETGCVLRSARPVALYRVRVSAEEWRVSLHRGEARGSPRAEDGSAVAWRDSQHLEMHPTLRRVLIDAGLRRDDERDLARSLREHGIDMVRLR